MGIGGIAVKAVEPIWHEFAANYLFDGHGLKPFFATDSTVKDGGGSRRAKFEIDGETWVVKLYYQDSGIVHPGSETPSGTTFALDTIREFRFAVARHPSEDSVGEQSFNAHLAPRWQGMEAESDDGTRTDIPVPDEFGEGVNVRITGSNIDAVRYGDLFRAAADAVGVAPWYFRDPHPFSNVQDAERYVRLHCDASGPVHARDGPIAQLGHLLEDDRSGYRKIVQNDEDDHGQTLSGYYHTVTLGPRRVTEAFPSHDLPKEVKHYYAREALSFPKDHPLRHPKMGVSYQVSRWDGKLGVSPDELEQLREELDETLHAVLADAGIDIAPQHGEGPYFPDAYFQADVTEGWDEPVALNLAHIEHEQQSVVIKHIKDGLSPVQWESLNYLVTDGGEVAPSDIADDTERHVDSVRRALRKMDDLVEREYNRVSLRSTYVAELVHDAVQQAEEAVREAAEAGAKALEAAERGLDQRTSAFIAWASRRGFDVKDRRDARLKLRFGEVEDTNELQRQLRQGFDLWQEMGRDAWEFLDGLVEYEISGQTAIDDVKMHLQRHALGSITFGG